MKYNYIAIEGNIGAGKTSLSTKIAEQFNAKLILENFEDNSFLPKFYEEPDKYAFPLEMSFLAERYQQLKDQLTDQDLFKSFTISDYFINKSLIFSRKTLQKDEYLLYSKLFDIIISSLPQPELLVYLYLDINKLKSNIIKRGRLYEQNIKDDYLAKIQEGYLDYIKHQNNMRILIIDTNNIDFVNSVEDYNSVIDLINKEYSPGIHKKVL
ncbi:MAG: deoxynucleoside kinase [Saprospiraceae bacterium]|nr:deoxynucleoside kinase [Saprospiraceae bacterium]